MVKLTQIDDESKTAFEQPESVEVPKTEPVEVASESDDSESESDVEDDFDFESETVFDRIVALKDIIAPERRESLVSVVDTVKSYANCALNKSGIFLWTLTSSALLLGVPLSLAILAETQIQEMEKEMSLQQSAQEVLAPGSEGAFAEKEAK